jgi:hypothetical protein
MMEANMINRRTPILTITLLACLLIAAGSLVNSTVIDWSVFTSSNGPVSSEQVTLDGTLGQPITGTSNSGSTLLMAGYWYTDKVEDIKVEYAYAIYLPQIER